MGMTEEDKRNCCLVEIQETEAKYYKTLEDIEKVSHSALLLSARSYVPGRALKVTGSLFKLEAGVFEDCWLCGSTEMSSTNGFIEEHKCHRN